MSDDKSSFVVYTDIKEIIDDLDDVQVATLFRAMVNYRITGRAPKLAGSLKYIFIPIRQQMDRDKEKWNKTRAARAESGRKGGIESGKVRAKQNEANEANAYFASSNEANEANEAVNVTGTVNATVNTAVPVTTTTTATKGRGGGSSYDDDFNIWKRLSPEDIDAIYDVYPESGNDLIQTVYEDVKEKHKVIEKPLQYILGYAKNVGWDDNAEHFDI